MTNTVSYVFNGVEVKLTGREAQKEIKTTSRRTQEERTSIQVRVEITPVNSDDGSWKKWVEKSELFTIENDFKTNGISKTA